MARTGAVNSLGLIKLVASGDPFHSTTAPEAKPLPMTVKVNAELPAVIVFGLIELMVGAATMVKVSWLEVTPPDNTLI